MALVKQSPVRFECAFDRVIELPGNPPMGTVRFLPFSSPSLFSLASLFPISLLPNHFPNTPQVDIIFGRVLAVHIADHVLTDGKIDVAKTEPIARLGYYEYAVIRDTFEMKIPGSNKALLDGLEGSSRANRELTETKGDDGVEGQLERARSAGAEAVGGEDK